MSIITRLAVAETKTRVGELQAQCKRAQSREAAARRSETHVRMVNAIAAEAKRVRDHARDALSARQEVSRDIQRVRISIAAGSQDSDG